MCVYIDNFATYKRRVRDIVDSIIHKTLFMRTKHTQHL